MRKISSGSGSRNRGIHRAVCVFLARHPPAVVVHIGCGLDRLDQRVDHGQVEWYDLDLPEVIGLRRKLIGGEEPGDHLLAGSAFEDAWL